MLIKSITTRSATGYNVVRVLTETSSVFWTPRRFCQDDIFNLTMQSPEGFRRGRWTAEACACFGFSHLFLFSTLSFSIHRALSHLCTLVSSFLFPPSSPFSFSLGSILCTRDRSTYPVTVRNPSPDLPVGGRAIRLLQTLRARSKMILLLLSLLHPFYSPQFWLNPR